MRLDDSEIATVAVTVAEEPDGAETAEEDNGAE